MPPETTHCASAALIACAASITALSPEPQTLLIVIAGTVPGRPAWIAAWRAGAWPTPPCSTLPMITSSTAAGPTPARRTASRITSAPRGGAGGQAAQILADGCAAGGQDDGDGFVAHGHAASGLRFPPGLASGVSPCRGLLTPGASPGIKPGFKPGDHSQTNGANERVRISSVSFATNSSIGSTTCFFPSPRARTA